MAAVSEKELAGVPAAGISKDRRVLRGASHIFEEVTVNICFPCCTQKQTFAPSWESAHITVQQRLHEDEDGLTWAEHP